MDKTEQRAIIAIVIILIVAIGIGIAGSDNGFKVFGIPIFALCTGLAFIIQWIAFIPAYIQKTEKFYDLTGSITYLTVMVISIVLSPTVDTRSMLLLGLRADIPLRAEAPISLMPSSRVFF